MKVLVLGAGIIGTSTAWHLLERGHDVTVVDRQPDAAFETSFGNAAQISVSYCEPWANRDAPAKLLKWMFATTHRCCSVHSPTGSNGAGACSSWPSAMTRRLSATCSSWWPWAPTATPP